MKKFLLVVAVAAVAILADSQLASAGRGGRGGRGGHGGCGGCGGNVGCGGGYGGCGFGGGHGGGYVGGCSTCGIGGHGGGYVMGGCATCGTGGGYAMGGSIGTCATCGTGGGYAMGGSIGTCPGGVCTTGSGAALAQANANEATLVVTLPEDAKLTIDGEETTSTSEQRVFVSPALQSGKLYEYSLEAKVLRDGKVQTATAQVTVRPGEVSRVELKVPAKGVAAQ
jgi:uncharacterized protein (TIGR03000 family)